MSELKRLTTQFVETEDRIRLAGEIDDAQTVALWLTQRLINRLIPHALAWLATQTVTQTRPDVLQGFAQQAAVASLTPQAPVVTPMDYEAWLVMSIDLKKTPEVLQLTFKGRTEAQIARLTLENTALRQWLGIVCGQYRNAQWPMDLWPDWIKGDASGEAARTDMLLH